MISQIQILIQFLLGDLDMMPTTTFRLRQLMPVVTREYAPQLREFGTLLVARLTEKNLSRGMKWATLQLAERDGRRRTSRSPTTTSRPLRPSMVVPASRK